MPENKENSQNGKNENSERKYKYDAFISYRHTEPDFTIVKNLHSMIEKFKVPKHLSENSSNETREFRVFRDREELSTKDLSTMIQEGLKESENLIVICSRRTPLSPWCRKEVQLFKEMHGSDNIIPVLIEGEPYESFIDELKNLKTTFINSNNEEEEKDIELLAADLRPEEIKSSSFKGYETLQNEKVPELNELTKKSLNILKKSEIYRIMASMLNVNYGDLKLRHQERRMKRIIYASISAVLVMFLFIVSVTTLYLKSVVSERKANEQSALMTLNMANDANSQGNRALAMLIAKEAMKNSTSKMDQYDKLVAQYTNILNNSLITLPFSNEFILPTESETAAFSISSDSKTLVSPGSFNNANIWNLENGGIIKTLTFDAPVTSLALSPDNKKIYAGTASNKLFEVNTDNYQIKEAFEASQLPVNAIIVSKNNKYLYVLRGLLIFDVFDIENHKKLHSFSFDFENRITGFKENPVTNNFFILKKDNSITEYDINIGQVAAIHAPATPPESSFRRELEISDNGILFYSDMENNSVKIVMKNLQTGQINTANNLKVSTFDIETDKEANVLYTHSFGNFVTRFDLSNLKPNEEINTPQRMMYLNIENNESIKNIKLSPDDNTLAVILANRTVGAFTNLKNMPQNSVSQFILNEKSTHKNTVNIIKFTPDSKKIITSAADSTIRVMNTKAYLGEIQSLNGKIVSSSRDKNSILILSGDQLSKYSFADNKEVPLAHLHPKYLHILQMFATTNDVSLVALSPGNSASADVFDVKQNKKVYTTKPHAVKSGNIPVLSKISFSNDGKFLFTLGPDSCLFVHDAKTGKFLFSLEDKENGIAASFVLSNDDNFVALNYTTGKSTIFSLETKKIIQKLDGEILAVNSENKKIKIIYGQVENKLFYSTSNNKIVKYADNKIKTATGTTKFNTVNISFDGKYYISGIPKNNTVITDLNTGETIRTLYTDTNKYFVSLPVINKDNRKIAYNNDENRIIITDMYSLEELSKKADEMLKGRKMTESELNSIGRRK